MTTWSSVRPSTRHRIVGYARGPHGTGRDNGPSVVPLRDCPLSRLDDDRKMASVSCGGFGRQIQGPREAARMGTIPTTNGTEISQGLGLGPADRLQHTGGRSFG